MADEKDRMGSKLHDVEKAREDQWARQRDEEIIAKLREKYAKAINCPQCGHKLDARVAIGVGGMACPDHHGAWVDRDALTQLHARLANTGSIRHDSLGEKFFVGLGEIVDDLRHKHPKQIDCPNCGAKLEPKAETKPGEAGLAGMTCPKGHGAWIDQDVLREIRSRLGAAAGARAKG